MISQIEKKTPALTSRRRPTKCREERKRSIQEEPKVIAVSTKSKFGESFGTTEKIYPMGLKGRTQTSLPKRKGELRPNFILGRENVK